MFTSVSWFNVGNFKNVSQNDVVQTLINVEFTQFSLNLYPYFEENQFNVQWKKKLNLNNSPYMLQLLVHDFPIHIFLIDQHETLYNLTN